MSRHSGKSIRALLQPDYPAREAANLARVLCCELFGQSQTDFYLDKDMDLSADDQEKLRRILVRLRSGEPIQYIMGTARFLCRDFRVGEGVLIPRPETEELVERMVGELPAGVSVLDMGTGSGCIAVSLAIERSDLEVTAWDISEAALGIARSNAEAWEAKVSFFRRDILTYQPAGDGQFDAIVSNPPYVLESEREEMEPNVLLHEPALALFVPDDDPLRFYRRIGELGRRMLKDDGRLYFEINRRFGRETAEMLAGMGYREVQVIKDISHNDRFVIARK